MGNDAASRARFAGFAVLVVAGLLALAAVLDLGPFADDELSPEQLTERGDEICAEAHERFRELQRTPPQTPSAAATLAGALADIAEEELERIEELEAPSQLAEPLDRYLRARERGIELLRAGERAADEGDVDAYERAQAQLRESQSERRRLAEAVGFAECSRELRPPAAG